MRIKMDLRNCDCMDLMKEFPDNHFDIIFTSPPYNLGKTHHTGNNVFKAYKKYDDDMPESKYQEWQVNVLNECYRVLKHDGSMFYNHKNRIVKGVSIVPYEWIFKTNFLIKQEIVWFNGSQNFDKIRFYPMTERVYWLTKNKSTTIVNKNGMTDFQKWNAVGTSGEHKRSFPIEMAQDILNCFPDKKEVLDPFLGSMTTALACYDLGMNITGAELDPDYFKAGMERVNKHTSQVRLDDII